MYWKFMEIILAGRHNRFNGSNFNRELKIYIHIRSVIKERISNTLIYSVI
jgi:hypothetical protein